MGKIAISYRRADSAPITGRLFDRLVAHYGVDSVFVDIDAIPLGEDFRRYIDTALRASDIMLAVIGHTWLGAGRWGHLRLKEENDPVRIEIETALRIGLPIIPVLVDGARMPKQHELPATLERFPYFHAAQLDSGRDFHSQTDRLIRFLDSRLQEGDERARPTAATTGKAQSHAASTPAESLPEIDSAYYYRLTTMFQGPEKSLDAVRDGTRLVPSLRPTAESPGQFWKLTPIIDDFYRLTTVLHGDGQSLDIVNDGQGNNIPCLASSSAGMGQYWNLTPSGGPYHRLTTKFRGPQLALDIINDGVNNTTILAPRASVSGQYWLLHKLTAAPPYAYW